MEQRRRALGLSQGRRDAGGAPRDRERRWRRASLVAAHEYVSKAEALARFKQTFGDLAAAVDALGDNPLPASLEVRLQPGPGVSASVDSLAATPAPDARRRRRALRPPVADRLLSAINVIRGVGLVLGSC